MFDYSEIENLTMIADDPGECFNYLSPENGTIDLT